MDNTQQNILMCEKAKEIQKSWKPSYGDNFIKGVFKNTYLCWLVNIYDFKRLNIRNRDKCIWLPRQDQLQEMVKEKFSTLSHLIYCFFSWQDHVEESYCCNFTSMEQLWLAFVMHELYQKKWNGTDWIKE